MCQQWITPVKLPFRAIRVRLSIEQVESRDGLDALRRLVQAFSDAFPSITGIESAAPHIILPALEGVSGVKCVWANGLQASAAALASFVRCTPDSEWGGCGNGGRFLYTFPTRFEFNGVTSVSGRGVRIEPQSSWNSLSVAANYLGMVVAFDFAEGLDMPDCACMSPSLRIDKYNVRQATQALVNLLQLNLDDRRQAGRIRLDSQRLLAVEVELAPEVLPPYAVVSSAADSVLDAVPCA